MEDTTFETYRCRRLYWNGHALDVMGDSETSPANITIMTDGASSKEWFGDFELDIPKPFAILLARAILDVCEADS